MSKKEYNRDFIIWKATVSAYVYKIIHKMPDEMNINMLDLYNEDYHPYVAAVMVILESDEYKNHKFYHDFIIPYKDKVVIANKTIH
jgi:hypothetical protein